MKFIEVTLALFEGFGENCLIFLATLLGAIPLGLVLTFGSMTKFKPVRWLTRAFIWIIRGTPLMLQIMIIFYVPGLIFNAPLKSRILAAIIAFIINYAAYFSEIYRGGIESIPSGQYEAGQVLGMTKSQIFFKIILLQVIKRIIPSMANEIITLVKDTSLARIIAVGEILMSAERYAGQGLIWPLFYTGVFFLIFTGILTILFSKLEKKLNYYRG